MDLDSADQPMDAPEPCRSSDPWSFWSRMIRHAPALTRSEIPKCVTSPSKDPRKSLRTVLRCCFLFDRLTS
ncbi:hypothetical protein TNCV_5048291 [Trichonephila clavipes]|nr:hypothetical protein TNCV_5048291 [Trichonephila clavipes]